MRLYSSNYDETLEYPLTQRPTVPASDWSSYVSGAIEELRLRDLLTGGFEGIVYGDVPLGGGLSSSAALEVATVVALQALFGFELDGAAAAKLCQQVEHQYAGVHCGIMDQFASRLGRRGHALFLDCRSLDYRDIPLALNEVSVMIVNSGVKRALASSKYNERRAECEQGVAFFKRFDNTITALRDVSLALLQQHEHELPDTVGKRCRHVISENQRVVDAAILLENGKLAAFGSLMSDSHASLRDLYEVSCPELDALVAIGQETDGVLGGRMTGAGFGGCAVFLLRSEATAVLEQRIRQEYPKRVDLEPSVFVLSDNLEAGAIPFDIR